MWLRMNPTVCFPHANRHHVSSGCTLIELLVFIAVIVCGLVGAHVGLHRVGPAYGWLLGGFLGCSTPLFGLMLLALLMDLWSGGGSPNCRNGCCRGPGMFHGYGDYKYRKVGEEYHYVCRCGVRYKRRGKRFVVVNDDGSETPYLVWHPFRGWFPDGSAGAESTQHGPPGGNP